MKTALQEVFSDLEKLHPNLFNAYTTEGKQFVKHFHKYLEMEKQQMRDANCLYVGGWEDDDLNSKKYI